MSELKDVIVEHVQYEAGADQYTDYKIVKMCTSDCPACSQRKLVEWGSAKCTEHGYYKNRPRFDCPACIQALRREVLE